MNGYSTTISPDTHPDRMERLAIYTCITGKYDHLIQSAAFVPWCDFIFFVPKGVSHPGRDGMWSFAEFECDHTDPVTVSRYAKMHPDELLPGYDFSLWIDGNIGIVSEEFFDILKSLVDGDVELACVPHPLRDCAYEEAAACVRGGKSTLRPMLAAVRHLSDSGLPRHAGLIETGVLFRKHSSPAVIALDRMWWDHFLHCDRRDQIALPLCLRETGMTPERLLPEGQGIRTSPLLSYVYHDRAEDSRFLQKKWRGFKRSVSNRIMDIRLRCLQFP